jgi:hypothetical protein
LAKIYKFVCPVEEIRLMLRRMSILIVGLCVLLTSTALHAEGDWKAGAAKVNITPESPMWMAGYASRDRVAEGKMTELWAKALAIEDPAGKRVVLVTLDLVGIERQLSSAIFQKLEEQHKLRREQVVLNCSHTHSGPVVAKNLRPMHFYGLNSDQQQQVLAYADKLQANVVAVVGQALEKLAPAKVEWGSGVAGFAVNRRTNKEPEVPAIRERGQPLNGPVDHDVPVLAIKDPTGKLTAVAFGYACHSTVLSGYDWSGDYPGFAQLALEKAHPDCIALFWAGCGADQNPLPRRTQELAEKYGNRLATAVDEVLDKPLQPIEGALQTSHADIPLALAVLPTREELVAQTNDTNKYVAMRAKMLLEDIDAGQPLSQTYPYPVTRWQLGPDVQWVFLGGEVVIDFAIRIKAELSGPKTWVGGYTSDVMAYIPSRRVLTEGGYEGGGAMVYYGLPTVWSEKVEEQIVAEVHRQTKGDSQGK